MPFITFQHSCVQRLQTNLVRPVWVCALLLTSHCGITKMCVSVEEGREKGRGGDGGNSEKCVHGQCICMPVT